MFRVTCRSAVARIAPRVVVAALLISLCGAAQAAPFGGEWDTSRGRVSLAQQDAEVQGVCRLDGEQATLVGKIAAGRLTFTYETSGGIAEGWFQLSPSGKNLSGQWRMQGTDEWQDWMGRRAAVAAVATIPVDDTDPFTAPEEASPEEAAPEEAAPEEGALEEAAPEEATPVESAAGETATAEAEAVAVAPPQFAGLWDTQFGLLRLTQQGRHVEGVYQLDGGSSLSGEIVGQRLRFTYREPSETGRGWFEVANDGQLLHGKWQAEGGAAEQVWTGSFVAPAPGRKYLVCIEARWEESLSEQEYALGTMLQSFFARAPSVEVRCRAFHDEPDLTRWCRELAFVAEPVVLVISSHGTPEGVSVGEQTIGPTAISESLKYAATVELLHFSCCSLLSSTCATDIVAALRDTAPFPVSGYTTEVDWASSAVIEFMYLDLILSRGMDAAAAAEELTRLMPFAGETDVAGAQLKAAGFKLLKLESKESAPTAP